MENGITNRAKISNKPCIKARLQYSERAQQRARLSPCRNVKMTKNFLRELAICLTKTPRGPRVQTLVHKGEGRGPHSSIFGRQLHHTFFSFSHLQTPHGQCNRYNRSCTYLSFSQRQRKLSVLMRCLF